MERLAQFFGKIVLKLSYENNNGRDRNTEGKQSKVYL